MDAILLLPVSLALAVLILAYTAPKSRLRLLAGIVILVFNWRASQSTVARWFPGLIGPEYILGWILACNSWINIVQLQYDPNAQSKEQPRTRLGWAIYQIFDTRWSVSAAQTPAFDKNRPQWVPSRDYFLMWKMRTILWTGTLLYLTTNYNPLRIKDIFAMEAGFLCRLGDVTGREIALRVYYGLVGIVEPYCCLCLMHAVCGLIAVGLFKDDPSGWKPLHGSPAEAWSVRNFYHKFWHQVMRKGFTTHAGLLVNGLLGLPRKHIVSRYLIAFFTFLISGIYHAALTPELPWRCTMQHIDYQLHILGFIILEDVITILWKKSTGDRGKSNLKHIERRADNSENKGSASNSGSHRPMEEVRYRFIKIETEDVVDNRVSATAPDGGLSQEKDNQPESSSLALRCICYVWTASIMIWLSSKLTFQTNMCLINYELAKAIPSYTI